VWLHPTDGEHMEAIRVGSTCIRALMQDRMYPLTLEGSTMQCGL
jgi:uncharacterized protein with von Willebrand factor type A (vWA) domain